MTKTVTDTNTVTNTVTVTNNNTNTITNTVTDGDLEPGHFEPVVVELQKLQDNGGATGTNGGGENHMHISEMLYRDGTADWPPELMYCSYTFGVLNATNPGGMSFQAQGWKHTLTTGSRAPGCIHLTSDEDDLDFIYTTHHGNLDDGAPFLSGWDLNSVRSNPYAPTSVTLAPTEIPQVIEPGVSYEGVDYENGVIWVAVHENGLAMFQRDETTNTLIRRGEYTDLTNAWDVHVDGDLAYVCDGIGGLVTLDVSNPLAPTEISRLVLEGQVRDIVVSDGIAYVAAESGGLMSIDVSDPANMILLDTEVVQGSAIAVDYDDGNVFLAAWNDSRVYDASDPADLKFIGAARSTVAKDYVGDEGDRPEITDRVLGIAGNDNYIFAGTWWVPTNYEFHEERTAPYMVLPENVNYLSFPGDLAIGESASLTIEVSNEGTAPLTVYDMWASDPAFTWSPSQLLIQPGASAPITVTFTATIGAGQTTSGTIVTQTGEESAIFELWSDDPNQPVRKAFLVGNAAGAGVGDPFPETTGTLLDGTEWSFTQDALGSKVTLLAYFATF